MREPRLEVAEVFRRYRDEYEVVHSASLDERRVLRDLVACRTSVLGGHLRRCDECGHEEVAYNSCRNRHCPKCQAQKQAQWLEAQCANLLDVPYYHIVFTLPEDLGPLTLQNKSLVYGLLFRSASETLLTIARDPKHLGARIGFTAVLHTWGQTLLHHPHVHCVVPAGGLSGDAVDRRSPVSPVDRAHWIAAREKFFLPVRVLSRLFREKFLAYLQQAYCGDELTLVGRLEELGASGPWRAFLQRLREIEWVVYAKPPFGSPEQVLKYLARYTHRVAISNRRLVSLEGGYVAFRYKDYRHGRRDRVMRLPAAEFIRRFLLHVLPKRFVRIRHYGLLANRTREENLSCCRRLIASAQCITDAGEDSKTPRRHADVTETRGTQYRCPACDKGSMLLMSRIAPPRAGPYVPFSALCYG